MSIVTCAKCGAFVDSDDDPECFVEVGNMRRLHKEIVMCERCRERVDAEHNEPNTRENIDEFTCAQCDRVRSMHEFSLNPEELICDDCTREREENEAERAYERHNEALMAGDIPTERERYLHAWDEKQEAKGRKGRGRGT